ncbi:Bifunctional protein HldE [Candidatus Rubidus massiliensis]|nr:Bifunctional protein HldE [Candidatus Rubidus massiliensis]
MPWTTAYQAKLVKPEQLPEKVEEIKQSGKTIATLNGSFDLMHAGHLHIIYEASKTADVLMVALNSDRSIQQYKSHSRPIIPLEYRLQMMAALEFVSYVTWFDETNPIELLEIIRPNVHVNGSEYGNNCIESEVVKKHGGKLYIVEKIDGLSTSKVLQKIHHLGIE